MGRKGDYKERPKSGPGRKAKKQGAPTFSKELGLSKDTNKKLSSRQKKRLKKREQKKEEHVKKSKPVVVEEEEEDSDEGIDEDDRCEQELQL